MYAKSKDGVHRQLMSTIEVPDYFVDFTPEEQGKIAAFIEAIDPRPLIERKRHQFTKRRS